MRRPELTTRWERLSKDEIRWLQGKKLARFVREQVLPFSAFYRDHFKKAGLDARSIRSIDDLQRIPLISKGDCAPSPADPDRARKLILTPDARTFGRSLSPLGKGRMALQALLRGKAWVKEQIGREYRPVLFFFTTGRSSDPVAFVLSLYDLEIMKVVGSRILQVIGADPAVDRGVNVFPYAPHLAFWQVVYCGLADGLLNLHTGGGRVMSTDRILTSIEKLRPTLLSGIPGYVYHMLRQGQEQGRDLSSVRLILLGGDRVSVPQRRKMIELLTQKGARNPQVLSVYGFTEARICFPECPAPVPSGFHVFPDLCIVETIDPETGDPVGEGEKGEIVYTAIDGRGSVVLRYRTGDIAEGGLVHEPCPHCGRLTPRILGPMSRVTSVVDYRLSKIKGTLVNLDYLGRVIADQTGVEEWQLVIGKKNDDPLDVDELVLHLALSEGENEAAVRTELENRLRSELEVGVNRFRFHPLAEMLERIGMETRLKEERVVDRRKELEEKLLLAEDSKDMAPRPS